MRLEEPAPLEERVPADGRAGETSAIRAVRELAELIRGEALGRQDFDLRSRALARELDAGTAVELASAAEGASTTVEERVVACDLLLQLHRGAADEDLPEPGPLAISLLAGILRSSEAESALASAAARALARFGTPTDRRLLLEQLVDPEGGRQHLAVWALSFGPASEMTDELAGIAAGPEPGPAERAVLVLGRLLDEASPPPGREAEVLVSILSNEASGAGPRLRAAAALAHAPVEEAAPALAGVLLHARVSEELARIALRSLRSHGAEDQLARIAAAPGIDADRALAVDEVLADLPRDSAEVRHARVRLGWTADFDPDPARRLRARVALSRRDRGARRAEASEPSAPPGTRYRVCSLASTLRERGGGG